MVDPFVGVDARAFAESRAAADAGGLGSTRLRALARSRCCGRRARRRSTLSAAPRGPANRCLAIAGNAGRRVWLRRPIGSTARATPGARSPLSFGGPSFAQLASRGAEPARARGGRCSQARGRCAAEGGIPRRLGNRSPVGARFTGGYLGVQPRWPFPSSARRARLGSIGGLPRRPAGRCRGLRGCQLVGEWSGKLQRCW